jgi:hypothetical protein
MARELGREQLIEGQSAGVRGFVVAFEAVGLDELLESGLGWILELGWGWGRRWLGGRSHRGQAAGQQQGRNPPEDHAPRFLPSIAWERPVFVRLAAPVLAWHPPP